MLRQGLKLHPDSRCDAVTHIEVEFGRPDASRLTLRYLVSCDLRQVLVPPLATSARADNLWEHTCFEAFVRATPDRAYHEFNFAPSTEWAAYQFDRYREGMRDASWIAPPEIAVQSNADCFEMHVSLALDALSGAAWRLGLSAVIEESGGRKSFWALRHPPGKPDFHHPDSFACELP